MAAMVDSEYVAASQDTDPRKLHEKWTKALVKSVKADVWGQVIEAVDEYTALSNDIVAQAARLQMTENDNVLLHRVVCALKARCDCATAPDGATTTPTADDMKKIVPAFEELFAGEKAEYAPFPLALEQLEKYIAESFWLDETSRKLQESVKPGGVLVPASEISSTGSHVSLELVDVGIKDAESFQNPFIRVTVMDRKGHLLEHKQETPVADRQHRYQIDINTIVHIQTSVEELREKDAAIFLELVHYKPLKHKHSTKAWSVLEMDELTSDLKVLEIYKKPVQPSRKKFKLLTTKKLFLQVRVHVK
ncbi:Axin interactor, dorsalization-associated protein [Hondaea fermentalgiana]|uniref:Axin interactor, dorsalization-associated protein n=1 Tax=Hondaea fermentalgiana TaxID=2315210 RepID=A0A2R5G6L0_9STRA|nr:Axin interactor, dorsalization-associated protein [Hondaea fermentalgiana]|eukprot:GBG26630.1 Axin interactor, dorsalization-associated protein [Hondaea fermentalgiana]